MCVVCRGFLALTYTVSFIEIYWCPIKLKKAHTWIECLHCILGAKKFRNMIFMGICGRCKIKGLFL